jgi:glycosyltransferase involved in cell wall biosynthesis
VDDVSIVIPTYRRPDALEATLDRLVKVDYPAEHLEVVVVDDGADDATRRVVERFAAGRPSFRYFAQHQQGAAAARNNGAREASGNVLIFLDDDMLVEPDHVRQHLATRARFGDCLVNGHWEFSEEALEAMAGSPFGEFRIWVENWVKEGIEKTPLEGSVVQPAGVTAANLSIERATFWELDGFDEGFPFAGCEDQDFSYRAEQAGHPFVYNPDIRLLHNDKRLNLRQFCARQQQGAATAVVLAAKHPDKFAGRPLITENTPITRADSPRLVVKKLVKRIAAFGPVLRVIHRVIDWMERRHPQSRALRRAYWGACGIYIFCGVRDGLNLVGRPELPA